MYVHYTYTCDILYLRNSRDTIAHSELRVRVRELRKHRVAGKLFLIFSTSTRARVIMVSRWILKTTTRAKPRYHIVARNLPRFSFSCASSHRRITRVTAFAILTVTLTHRCISYIAAKHLFLPVLAEINLTVWLTVIYTSQFLETGEFGKIHARARKVIGKHRACSFSAMVDVYAL